jgi:hypothetical protein
MDKLDKVLFANGFEFREGKDWEACAEEMASLMEKYWDDLTGGDSDYDPKKPNRAGSSSSDGEVEVSGEVSSDEEDDDDDDDDDSSSSEEEKPAKAKKQKK